MIEDRQAELWRWIVRGFGGAVSLVRNAANDGIPIPDEHRKQLEEYRDELSRLIDRMKDEGT